MNRSLVRGRAEGSKETCLGGTLEQARLSIVYSRVNVKHFAVVYVVVALTCGRFDRRGEANIILARSADERFSL